MGRSISVDTLYGIEIANYDGFLFDDDEYRKAFDKLGLDEDGDDSTENLLLMFLGHADPEDLDYVQRQNALKAGRLEVVRGGYEYSTVIVKVRDIGQRYYGWVRKLEIHEDGPSVQDAQELVRFIEWLDSEGLRLQDSVRSPGWHLMTSYG